MRKGENNWQLRRVDNVERGRTEPRGGADPRETGEGGLSEEERQQ